MNYECKIFGMYSHKNKHAQIFDCTRQERQKVKIFGKAVQRIAPALIYDKTVTYETYKRNLRKLKNTKG